MSDIHTEKDVFDNFMAHDHAGREAMIQVFQHELDDLQTAADIRKGRLLQLRAIHILKDMEEKNG